MVEFTSGKETVQFFPIIPPLVFFFFFWTALSPLNLLYRAPNRDRRSLSSKQATPLEAPSTTELSLPAGVQQAVQEDLSVSLSLSTLHIPHRLGKYPRRHARSYRTVCGAPVRSLSLSLSLTRLFVLRPDNCAARMWLGH